jgi:hypothetical protein
MADRLARWCVLVCGVWLGWCAAGTAAPLTLLVETDAAANEGWTPQALAGASGGTVLQASARERLVSAGLTLVVPAAGHYRLWVRYHRPKAVAVGCYVLVRDDQGDELAARFLDWSPIMPTEHPWAPPTSWAGDRTGFLWEACDLVCERPLVATVTFGPTTTGMARRGEGTSERQMDCLLLTSDLALNPATLDATALAALATAPPALAQPRAPWRMVWSPGLPDHVDAYAGTPPGSPRFEAGLIQNGPNYRDEVRLVRLGFNHDHAAPTPESARLGIVTHGYIEAYQGDGAVLAKRFPEPEGRFVNAEGQVGKAFSYHFPPVAESSARLLAEKLAKYLEQPQADAIGAWRLSVEDGGFLDYSPVALTAFRGWLQERHGDIATLNRRWSSDYADFAAIVPPAAYAQGPAAWLEFRAFSGQTYAQAVARQVPIVQRLDPRRRQCIGANSSLDLFAPYFSAFRPIDFDELLNTAYADQPHVSWDTYCADDQLACETALMAAMGNGRKPVVQEWSNHVVDARIAARSYWGLVSQGVAGIYLFMFQEGFGHATYPKWALLSHDRVPKPKLAAYADAVQEVHRLEPLLMAAQATPAAPPVALYWSRLDLGLAAPHDSLYGCPLNSPIHVFRTLRGLGYQVRWITPRQVLAGELDRVGALVLIGANHVPEAVAGRIAIWVQGGGVIVGDDLPGAFNEYGQPQDTLAPLFGVRAAERRSGKAQPSKLAVQQSTQGYGEVTDAAVERKEHFTMVDEVAQQPGATHLIAHQMGDYMVSGIAPRAVECVAGTVVGMTHRGTPGFVVNTPGRGDAFYSALLLGTVYESGGTRYEWDTTHSGLAYGRLLEAYLRHAGVPPASQWRGLAPRVAAKLRVEAPLLTPAGDVLIGMTSLNDDTVPPGELTVALPSGGAGPFRLVLAATGGSRRLQPVPATVTAGRLVVTMPAFDTHATLLALREAPPLLGLDLGDVPRGVAHLAELAPGQRFTVEVTLYNGSSRALPAGEVTLATPAGWLQSALAERVGGLAAGAQRRCRFQVQAPAFAGARRLVPLLVRYQAGETTAPPATEMVWWGQAAPTASE